MQDSTDGSAIVGGYNNCLTLACSSFILGSYVTGCQSNTVYLNKEANYSNSATIIGTTTETVIGPLEANMRNPSGASLFNINLVATHYSGASYNRHSYYFKQWSQAVVESNVLNGTGCVTVNSGLLYSCFNSDAAGFPAGAMGLCATLTGSGNGVSGIYLYLKNRATPSATSCTVFTVNISRLDS
jgi:hypothetical protein